MQSRVQLKDSSSSVSSFHSLRVLLAAHLFDAEVDERHLLIMNCTGHSSTDGVRAYKSIDKAKAVDFRLVKQHQM